MPEAMVECENADVGDGDGDGFEKLTPAAELI